MYTPVKECAVEHDIDVYQPEKVKEEAFLELMEGMAPDVIVVVAFGQILPPRLLAVPEFGCVNVHASLLPKYRGAAPIQWAVIDGEKESGVTTMYMSEGLDKGDMLEQSVVSIASDETGGSLFHKLSKVGGTLLLSTLHKLESKSITPIPQNEEESTYAKMLKKEMGFIDYTKSATIVESMIRGMNPWPSAYTYMDGKMLKVWKAEVVNENSTQSPGTVVSVDKQSICVQTGDGQIRITELQLEGKKRMETSAFLLGYQIVPGKMLGDK